MQNVNEYFIKSIKKKEFQVITVYLVYAHCSYYNIEFRFTFIHKYLFDISLTWFIFLGAFMLPTTVFLTKISYSHIFVDFPLSYKIE